MTVVRAQHRLANGPLGGGRISLPESGKLTVAFELGPDGFERGAVLLVHHISVHATEGVSPHRSFVRRGSTRRHAGSKRSESAEPLAADRITAVPKSSA